MIDKKDEVIDRVENLIKIMRNNATKRVKIQSPDWNITIEQQDAQLTPTQHEGSRIVAKDKEQEEVENGAKVHQITTPLVGTFYRSPSPETDPYVEVGDQVEPGQILCIVEAMKVMNEIHSDTAGIISRILVENEQMVEFGEPLFEIEKKEIDNGA